MKNWGMGVALVTMLAGGSLLGAACGGSSGGGGGGTTIGQAAGLELTNRGTPVSFGSTLTVSPGAGSGVVTEPLTVTNNGNAALEITALSIASTPEGVFSLQSTDGGAFPNPIVVAFADDLEASVEQRNFNFRLKYDPAAAAGQQPSAVITIRSNAVLGGEKRPVVTINVSVDEARPRLQVVPAQVNFGNVAQDKSVQKSISLLNAGTDTLVIDSFVLQGHPAFSLAIGAQIWPVSVETSSAGITLENPIEVDPGTSISIASLFEPTGPEPAEGTLILYSNDPLQRSGTVVPLQGNVGGPCIAVNPKKVDFGGKLVGKPATVDVEITSCGDQPLEINEVVLTADASPDFTLALETLPGVTASGAVGSIGPADPPVVLQPNQTGTFQVVYIPDEINPTDGNGQPIPDLGQISIKSNAFIAELNVDVRGFGVPVECPTAVIIVQEGEEVIPQTKLHVVGSQSYAATGNIESYRWEVQQPVGSQSVFLPSAAAPDPTFEANVAGTYVFRLTVTDSGGVDSCVPAEATVYVNPDEAIHIELLWDTPNDPDQTDEGPVAGADMDLHFAHPFATGGYDGDADGKPDGWFDGQFDCFWFNHHPNWGSLDPAIDDDPGLDRDDTDGAGPENVNLNTPENGLTYKVGVHYWNDHGYGPSYATIRVYIFSNPVFELEDVELLNHDMWTVSTIDWPAGTVKLARVCAGTTTACASDSECGGGTCGLRIARGYTHPFFPNE